ncbi:MAG TPA: addiction module toxin RelE [Anaerolineae bacterium]|nr:addiction module toxin RelE [Anaerolineae bacterium]
MIRRHIENHLLYEPDVVARNRKPLRQPALSTWELRFGPNNRFRVFYDVDREAHEVYILAIGVKIGNRLIIDNEEIEL